MNALAKYNLTGQQIHYSFINVLTGSDLSSRRLALMEAKSIHEGPVVWLTGCVHGEEVGGIAIIQEIFKKLKKDSSDDLNRSFPGNSKGSLAERIADKIFTTIMSTHPTLVLDLHNDWTQSIPYTLIDPYPGAEHKEAYEKVKAYAEQTGFVVINEQEEADDKDDLKRTLSGSLLLKNIPAITLELGEAYIVNEQNVEEGVKAIWNILVKLGMVNPTEQKMDYSIPAELQGKILHYSHQPVSSASGIIRFKVKPGQLVKKDQPIAKIYNVFGRLEQTLVAEHNGIVLGHADSSVALPGEPIVSFGFL
ncbi:MAG: AspA [Candidatus Jorgensenbacteria bacterium GW2011_GWC1_48_8]|uniref:AspA n=1 Tax=Candidatus Jorgensenbacteria bacterium GW2011_GWC1_48_8 TaxID=1618666 RepID=A0A0G1X7Q2_9BACT|nr:MAG: AspA [Candidatus Jorgensenbacteria bacterium GW2011_GWC1_48_8]